MKMCQSKRVEKDVLLSSHSVLNLDKVLILTIPIWKIPKKMHNVMV